MKGGLEKRGMFFYLRPTILDVWDMSNGFMTNWVTVLLDHFDTQLTEVSKLWADIIDFYH